MAVNDDVEQCLFPAVDGDGDGDDYGASMNRVSALIPLTLVNLETRGRLYERRLA